jgi:hypothetical protein
MPISDAIYELSARCLCSVLLYTGLVRAVSLGVRVPFPIILCCCLQATSLGACAPFALDRSPAVWGLSIGVLVPFLLGTKGPAVWELFVWLCSAPFLLCTFPFPLASVPKVLLSAIRQVVASCHSLLRRGLLPLVDMIGQLLLVGAPLFSFNRAPLGGSCQPSFLLLAST